MQLLVAAATALLVVGCALAGPGPGASPPSSVAPQSPVSAITPEPSPRPAGEAVVPVCDDVPRIQAPAEYYRDSPIYVGNEMPANDLRAWAASRSGFETLWIDRDHHGWVTLAFSKDAAARQQELEAEFPDVGAVAVGVDWTMRELEAVNARVRDELSPDVASSWGILVDLGMVAIGIGVLSTERIAAVAARFAGERVCVEGIDPSDAPPEGPQPQAGDGWRLLADADGVGPAYRTGIAYDDASYAELWRTADLDADRPNVDFETEVVIWFGVVTGSICPPIRMDDVVVDADRALIYPQIVHVGFGGCTDDIHPHAYVVALERSRLPSPPFAIQLDTDGPPGGAPEERTIVDADLSQPGAVAEPGEVHGDPSLPEPQIDGPGTIVEPGYEFRYRQSTHCGLEWLGPINAVHWRTPSADSPDWIPGAWRSLVEQEQITLRVIVDTGPPPILRAKAGGHTVVYEASPEDPPGCD